MAAGDGQSGAEIVPERDFELGAGLGQTEEGVSTVANDIAARAAADLSAGDVAADAVEARGLGAGLPIPQPDSAAT